MQEVFEWLTTNLMNLFITIANFFIEVIETIINFLPRSPFRSIDFSGMESIIANVNWFIPIGQMLDITALWCGAIFTYYCYMHILRLIKVIK